MDLFRLLKLGQKMAGNLIKATYKHTLTVTWYTTPVGVGKFNNKTGRYEDNMGNEIPQDEHHIEIPALFDEAPNTKYKYEKYGVNVETDVIAIVPEDIVIPKDTTAIYTRVGDKTEYRLKQIIKRSDIGVAPGPEGTLGVGMPETAYKILHLRSGNLTE